MGLGASSALPPAEPPGLRSSQRTFRLPAAPSGSEGHRLDRGTALQAQPTITPAQPADSFVFTWASDAGPPKPARTFGSADGMLAYLSGLTESGSAFVQVRMIPDGSGECFHVTGYPV